MVEPKTNWVKSDYFNVDDFNRITQNLNEESVRGFEDAAEYDTGTVETLLLRDVRHKIAVQYASIRKNTGWQMRWIIDNQVSTTSPNWFNFTELNSIEGLCKIINERYSGYDRLKSQGIFMFGGGKFLGGGIL